MPLVARIPLDAFLRQLDELAPKYPRIREIMRGLEWVLCHVPTRFPVLEEYSSDEHRIARATLEQPPLYVYFALTDSDVRLLLIEER
jgi:hypothetical protein